MYDEILVPTDGSDTARTASSTAITLAKRHDARLHVVHAVELIDLPVGDARLEHEIVQHGNQLVNDVDEQARASGLETRLAVLEKTQPVHELLLDYVHDHGVDLVVMGTRGRTGVHRLFLGSVTERMVGRSNAPVLTVHEETTVQDPFDSILVPYDSSEGARAAAAHAIDLARDVGATVHFCHVIDQSILAGEYTDGTVLDTLRRVNREALQEASSKAEEAGAIPGETTVTVGVPHRKIVEYAAEIEVDCLVMGTHGRSGVGQKLLGSVTERVIRMATGPVLTVGKHPVETSDSE